MRFHEEWFSVQSQRILADLVHEVSDIDGLLVEVGSWEGCSTIAIANAAHPRVVHAVDTWAGSPGEISEHLATQRDVFAQFQTNIEAGTAGNVEPHRMGWRDYVPTITEPVALVFIDAEHTYREVTDTITAFRPLMAAGGVVCGDDAGHPPVRTAVLEQFPEAMVHWSVWWART